MALFLSEVNITSKFFLECIQYCIGVGFVTRGEDDHLIIFFRLLKAIINVWTDIDASIDALTLLKLHRYRQVIRQILNIIHTVN